MEPQAPGPEFGPEQAPPPVEHQQQPEHGAEQDQTPESASEAPKGAERAPQPESKTQPSGLPALAGDDDTTDDQAQPAVDAPAPAIATMVDPPVMAADVDVIEREWVDKAKQIIDTTQNDPHAQEAAMEKLQIAYLRARYGKDIKPEPSEG